MVNDTPLTREFDRDGIVQNMQAINMLSDTSSQMPDRTTERGTGAQILSQTEIANRAKQRKSQTSRLMKVEENNSFIENENHIATEQ